MRILGSRQQITILVDEHYVELYRYAYRLTGSANDAEDLTQDAFCQAQQKFHQLRDISKAKSWLFSILRNIYLHRLRAEKKENVIPLDWVRDIADDSAQHVNEIEPEKLQEALNQLPEVYRTPIILYYFSEFSYRDIAEHMDLPIGTVMSRLARAKAHLRTHLLPQMSEMASGND